MKPMATTLCSMEFCKRSICWAAATMPRVRLLPAVVSASSVKAAGVAMISAGVAVSCFSVCVFMVMVKRKKRVKAYQMKFLGLLVGRSAPP